MFLYLGVWIYNLDFCTVQITSRWLCVHTIFCYRVIFIMKTDSSLISLAKSHLSYFNMKYSLRRHETRTCLSSKMYIIFFPILTSKLFNIFSQSKRSLFIYVFPSRYNVSLSGNERVPLSLRLAATKQTEIFIISARTAYFSFLFVVYTRFLSIWVLLWNFPWVFSGSYYRNTYIKSWLFFLPPISLRINTYLDMLPSYVML